MSATHDPRESPECHCDVCKAFRREKAAAHLADSELLAALSAAVDDQGDWPEWKRIELKRRLAAERFFEGESDADAAAFAAIADAIKHESDNIKLKAERSAFVKLTLERSNEVDRLRAENARQAETIASLDSYAKRLESDSVRQAETIARLRELVTEFADHAADSAWHNTAEELRRRLREALKETP